MNVKGMICEARLHGISTAAGLWKRDHQEAMKVRDVEDLVRECLGAHDLLTDLYQEAWHLLLHNELTDVQAEGRFLELLLHRAERTWITIQERIHWAQGQGYSIDRSAELDQAIESGQRMSRTVSQRWPFIDPQQIEQARAELTRGEFQTVEEILGELQAQNPAPDQG
jgi:hypothetical protein